MVRFFLPYGYSFCQIFQALRLFPALRLLRTLEYLLINLTSYVNAPLQGMGLQCITDCPHQIFRFSTGSSAMKLKSIVAVVGRSTYIRVEKYVLALIGSAIWPFQLEKLHSLRKIHSTRFQVIQKIWQMTWWSRNSSSFNFQLHFHPRNCELEMKAPFFYFFLNFPTHVCQLFSFIIAHSKCLLFMEVLLLSYIPMCLE